MTTNTPDNNLRDDEVLAKLYKGWAKDTPPAKLNSEILNYAANANKSAANNNSVGSHFGGGWKVPLSMAASVVVVFALLVQLDQSPQQLELPPIPELSIPTEGSAIKSQPAPNEELYEAEEALTNDAPSFKADSKESDMDSQTSGALIIDKPVNTETQIPTDSMQTDSIQTEPNTSKPVISKKSANRKIEEKAEVSRERIQHEATVIPSSPTASPTTSSTKPPSSITKSKSESEFEPKFEQGYAQPKSEKLAKPQAAQKQMQAPAKDNLGSNTPSTASDSSSGAVMQQRSMSKSRDESRIHSDMAADTELVEEMGDEQVQTEAVYAPIPVEDWLLMIEKLVAQKDYAEAARQLEKFKQAHPKVDVEDLNSKIP